ncbi:MAG: pyridoxamine 5'-phosphate oxidase family protein [Gammaproteobacteria bacterium]|nr:pyridoxamine 5'-phosphate oxidase family protein [Gammaproteobacteria bacterium]
MPLLPAWAADWPVGHLATSAGHVPHVVAVVFCEVGEEIWIPIDGKPKSGAKLKRVRNIETNGHVSLLVDQYDENWSKLRWVRIDGAAEVVTMPADVAAAFRVKYPQYRSTRLGDTCIRVTVRRSREWSATTA